MSLKHSTFALALLGLLAGGACSPDRPATRAETTAPTPPDPAAPPAPERDRPPIPAAGPGLAPGTVQATVLIGACGVGTCEGTVLGGAVMGAAAPVVNEGEVITFAVSPEARALRQGASAAFREGAALRLTLASAPPMMSNAGAPAPQWTVLGVLTPGLR